jgi:hypothetical protein
VCKIRHSPVLVAESILDQGPVIVRQGKTTITMEREEIKINLKEAEFGLHTINYDCTFYFKNTTSEQQKVLIGFPHKLNSHFSPEYEIDIAEDWYNIALQMNPSLLRMAEKDKDLENLFIKMNKLGKN